MTDVLIGTVKVGDRVRVYDRYRFAVPVEGEVTQTAAKFRNDGVEVKLFKEAGLHEGKPWSYVWVHERQVEKVLYEEKEVSWKSVYDEPQMALLVRGIEGWITKLLPMGTSQDETFLRLKDEVTGAVFLVRRES